MKTRLDWWAGVAVAMMFGLPALAAKSTEVPAIDTSGMEARVRILIEETHGILEDFPDVAGAWGQMGRILHAHELRGAAVQCYEQAIQREPDNYRWPYLAAVAVSGVELETAARFFQQAAFLQPNDHASILKLTSSYIR